MKSNLTSYHCHWNIAELTTHLKCQDFTSFVKKSNIFTYATLFFHSLFVPSSIKVSLKNFHLSLNLFLTVSCVFAYEYIYCVVYIHTVHYMCVYTYGTCWYQSPSPAYLPSSLMSLLPTRLFLTVMSFCCVLWCTEFNQGHLSVFGLAISHCSTCTCQVTRKGSLEWISSW